MSDHIAHIAICDDVFRLAARHPAIPDSFKRLFSEQRDMCHMGAVTRSADKWSAELIARSRDTLAGQGQEDPNAEKKLAFVLGALTHRSADRHMKPITRAWKDPALINESKIYQDLFAFREIFQGGRGPEAAPFSWLMLLNPTSDTDAAFEEYYRVLLRRALIGMHTLNPDKQGIDSWLDSFIDGLQTFPKSLRQYAEINATWDQDKVRRYLIEKHFYDHKDEIIRLARGIQHGTVAPDGEAVIDAIAHTDDSCSRWARTLAKAVDYLLVAADLFADAVTVDDAKPRLDIGVPELAIGDHQD